MWVVIDTNIFFDDLSVRKSLHLLFKDIENVDFSLRIPEIIVREVVNIFRERRQTLLSKLTSNLKEINSFTSLEYSLDINDKDLSSDLEAFEGYLRQKIEFNGEVTPIPDIDIENLIERDLDRRRPFKENGVGFRDALIWETILYLITCEGCDGISFISKNTKDFSDNNNNLHPDLFKDIEKLERKPDIVRLFVSVEQFLETMVIPLLKDLREFRDAIAKGTHPHIDLKSITEQYIWDLITGFEVDPDCLPDYQEDNYDLSISSGVSEYEILTDELTVKRLSGNELLITASYILDCELHVFVPHWDTHHKLFDEQGFFISDSNWNETYALATIVLPFKIILRYVFNEGDNVVTSADIVSAECLENEDN